MVMRLLMAAWLCPGLALALTGATQVAAALSPTVAASVSSTSAMSVSPAAVALSKTADLPLITETAPAFEPNHPVEDFFVVSIISLPFTALWTLVGATVVASVSQKVFPPNFDEGTLISAGAIAAGASVSIGLVSATWGTGKAAPAHAGAPTVLAPLALPTAQPTAAPSVSPNSVSPSATK
jgi:hypothetical protein